MKKFFLFAFCLIAFVAVKAQADNNAPEVIALKETEFDFGKIIYTKKSGLGITLESF